jgi:hypothetical protein
MKPIHTIRRRWSTSARVATGRLIAARDESGQAMVIAILFVFLVAALVPTLAASIDAQGHEIAIATSSDAALAAAEAGVQEYRNYLDNVPGYYAYTTAAPAPGDLAMTGWKTIPGTSPTEAFHYIPNATQLTASSGGSQGQLLLEVTGRAGNSASSYQYRSILVSFSLSGILTDSYYSEYELNDLNEPGVLPEINVTVPGQSMVTEPMSGIDVSYSYTNAAGTVTTETDEPLDVALCKYHTYNENTFIDSLGDIVNPYSSGGTSGTGYANKTNPYYGPYYNQGFTYTYPAGSTSEPPSTLLTLDTTGMGADAGACDYYGVGIYNSGVTFAGIAYTNDQFWLCGNPTFDGTPPLVSGAPVGTTYGDDWDGSRAVVVNGTTVYEPMGYVDDFHDNCSGTPNYGSTANPKAPELGGSQHLPPTDLGLVQYADGASGNGCLYTGPTMIEFVKGGTMNVWSPLTKNTEPDFVSGTKSSCGTFSPSSPFYTGASLPNDGVIYVQTVPGNTSDPNYWATLPAIGSGSGQVASGSGTALPAGATCINPFYSSNSATSAQCSEGDALVEGELHGQVTLATAANVIVTRDVTYACADGSGGASSADPSSVTACNASGTNDVLGLLSNAELIVDHPTSGSSNVGNCSDDGTESSPGISNVTPTCDIDNAVIDAAAVTLQGSTYVPNFQVGASLGNLYENGTNINYYPGFNGTSGGAGYEQQISYDSRLGYDTPPHILQATDSVWDLTAFVVCGTVDTAGMGNIDCPKAP